MPLVFLLRNGTDDDEYSKLFGESDILVENICVLEFTSCEVNVPLLLCHVEKSSGLIFTSKESVLALYRILQSPAVGTASPSFPTFLESLKTKPMFTVGFKTAELIQKLFSNQAVGKEAGTAAVLAEEIALRQTQLLEQRPLLFLCGDQRREELPTILAARNILVSEQEVYKSQPVAGIADYVAQRVDLAHPAWVVFFSPSGVRAILPRLLQTSVGLKYAAIGPTTGTAVAVAGGKADAVASTPTPAGLLAAILASM